MFHNLRIGTGLLTDADLDSMQDDGDADIGFDQSPTPAEILQIRTNYVINNCS